MQAFKNIEMIFKYIEDTTDTILLKDFLIRQDSAAIFLLQYECLEIGWSFRMMAEFLHKKLNVCTLHSASY